MSFLASSTAGSDCGSLLFEVLESPFSLFDADEHATSDNVKTQSRSGASRMMNDVAQSENLPHYRNLMQLESIPGHSSSFTHGLQAEHYTATRDRFVIRAQSKSSCLCHACSEC